jgi:hypothetical protein
MAVHLTHRVVINRGQARCYSRRNGDFFQRVRHTAIAASRCS